MFGKITEFAIETNRITVLVLLAIPVIGLLIFLDYPRQEDPSIEIREAIIATNFPGMDVYEIEELITYKVEEKVREIGEVDDIWSYSKNGTSIVHVELDDWVRGDEIQLVWKHLRNQMSDLQPSLPRGTIGPFVNDQVGLTAVATIALWSDGWSLNDMRQVARDTRRRLDSLRGVERIETFGIQPERVFLEISNSQLAQLGIPTSAIISALQTQNILLPNGVVNADGKNVMVEASGAFQSIEDIETVLIAVPDSDQTIALKDIAQISRDYVDPADRPVLFNGRPAIILSVSILDGVNSVEFGERLTKRLDEVEYSLPFGYFLEFATYQPVLVEKAINGALVNLAQTLVIVLFVVIVFLGLRTGLIVGSFIPLTILIGLIGMSMWNVELQRMSIATMIIALGMMVDSAIVIAENIRNRLERGEDRRFAAIEAGRTLGLPLLTSTLTTILAFMPIAMAQGNVGEYTVSIGQVIILVLLSSWFMSMYMTPTMSYWFLKVTPKDQDDDAAVDPYDTAFYRRYRRFLEAMLRWRLVSMVAVLVVAVVIGYSARFIIKEFFPENDRNQFLVYIDLEAGAHIDETSRVVERLSDWFADDQANPEVTKSIAYAGSGGPRFFLSLSPINPDPHVAFVLVETKSNLDVGDVLARTRQFIDSNFPEARGEVKKMWFGASETGLVQIRLIGSNETVLRSNAEQVMAALRSIPKTVHISHDWANSVLKVDVNVDQARARRAGVTSEDIANSLGAFVTGAEITGFREGDSVIPLVLRGVAAERGQLAGLQSLNVHSAANGTNVPLSQVASISTSWDPYFINRRNLERTITISANNENLSAGQLIELLQPTLDELDLPDGYRFEIGGELEDAAVAQGHLFASFPLAGFLIVVLLIWQFNSVRRAGIILITIPIAFLGSILGLLVTGTPFGFMTLLGLLSLAGIIINNGIVLIDSIETECKQGRDPYEAIIRAATTRLRPILMTTITTILGLMPLIIWQNPLFYSMAIVISFGLGFGTILTLGVVPVIYSLFFRVSAK